MTHSNTSHRGKCTLLRGAHHAQSLGTHHTEGQSHRGSCTSHMGTNHTQEHITQRHVYIIHRLHILAHITHRDTCIINRGTYHPEALITKATYYIEAHIDTEALISCRSHTEAHITYTHRQLVPFIVMESLL